MPALRYRPHVINNLRMRAATLCNQRKYVQKFQQRQGVEDARRQLCQAVTKEASESNKK